MILYSDSANGNDTFRRSSFKRHEMDACFIFGLGGLLSSSSVGLTSLSHPDIFFFPIINTSRDGETRGAIFPLQRNGENRGGVERVSFGLQNGEKQSSLSSSGSQIGEQQSSYSSSRGVVASVSFKHPSLSDAFERVSPALPIGEQHFHSSSTGEKAEGLVLAWRNLPWSEIGLVFRNC